jgi:hypothetical protein
MKGLPDRKENTSSGGCCRAVLDGHQWDCGAVSVWLVPAVVERMNALTRTGLNHGGRDVIKKRPIFRDDRRLAKRETITEMKANHDGQRKEHDSPNVRRAAGRSETMAMSAWRLTGRLSPRDDQHATCPRAGTS